MVRLLGKFTTGEFCHDTKKNRIGLISKQSDLKNLVIEWLPGHSIVTIPLNAGNKKQVKAIKRARKFKKLSLADFRFLVGGAPSRVTKVLQEEDHSVQCIRMHIQTIWVAEHTPVLDSTEAREIFRQVIPQKVEPQDILIRSKRVGGFIETAVDFFIFQKS